MMINVQGIEQKLKSTYAKVETVANNVYRCEKQVNGKPTAIYYFDCTGELKTSKDLVEYQDAILAQDYFSRPGSIQWNYYLTFITENLLNKENLKKEIEEDIKYTRKFVIEDSAINEFINFSELDINNDPDASNTLLGRWINKLDKANLSGIYQDEPRTRVIRDYLEGNKSTTDSQTSNAQSTENEKYPFIKSIILENYRDWPSKGTYYFGPVNLITGSNGVGKTSLLEAIEYYFCGKSKRNLEQQIENNSLFIELDDKNGPQPFKLYSTSEYQNRSSQWFRKPTSRGNTLYEGFNQLLFYNTDAAFSLTSADDNKKIFEAMSSLALGEEINRVSARIESFVSDFEGKIAIFKNQKQKSKELLDQELLNIKEIKKQTSEQPSEVKALIVSLLHKLKMKSVALESSLMIAKMTKNVRIILSSISSIRSELNWIPEISINSIEIEITKYRTAQECAQKQSYELGKLADNAQAQESLLSKLNDELKYIKKLQNFLKSGYFELNEKLAMSEKTNEKNDKKLEILESLNLEMILRFDQTKTAIAVVEEITSSLKDVDKQTKLLDDQLENISSQVSNLVQLSESIKKMGKDFIETDPKAVACPLCNTPFQPVELKKRIYLPPLKTGDAKGIPEIQSNLVKLRTKKRELQERKTVIVNYRKKIEELANFGLIVADTKPLEFQVRKIRLAKENIENEQDLMLKLRQKLDRLAEKGYDEEAWWRLKAELKYVKRQIKLGSDFSDELIEKGLANVQSEIEACQKILAGQKDLDKEIKSKFIEIMKKTFGQSVNVTEKAKEIEGNLIALSRCLEQINRLQSSIEISKRTDLSIVNVDLKRVEEWFEKLSVLSKVEVDRATNLKAAMNKAAVYKNELKSATKAYNLTTAAHKVLTEILEKDSKSKAVEDFVNSNHAAILSIFKKIHAPNEFDDIRFEETRENGYCIKLYRYKQNTWACLSEISTGQRSALALSVFLALNLRVTGGPRLLLIDDPVAHIDDLNTLSFLDYLKEIVVKNKRQVFFTTASRKLANLFEMKFSGIEGFPLYIHRLKR
jgi:DNA repair exonuclease SbcCD ATPase subunit